MKVKAGLYARVSTLDKGQDPQTQIRELRERCQKEGWEIAGEYVDEGVSGGKDRRPQLDRLMADAKKGKFSVIVAWRLDRFSRSLKHLVLTLDELRASGVSFVSLAEQIDLSTAAGRLVYHVLGAVAEFVREVIRENVRSGLAAARVRLARQGRTLGRPRVLVNTKTLVALRAEGLSYRNIAKRLGVGEGTVIRAFLAYESAKNLAYDDSVSDSKPWPIVTPEQARQIEMLLARE